VVRLEQVGKEGAALIPANIWQLVGIAVILFYVFRDPGESGSLLLAAGDASATGVSALQGQYNAGATVRRPNLGRRV
jgi:hypothetical protein